MNCKCVYKCQKLKNCRYMYEGKLNAISILKTLQEQNKTEALDGNESAKKFLQEIELALEWAENV